MTEYNVSGERESGIKKSTLEIESGHLEVKQAVRIEPTVRAGGPTVALDIDDDDLLEVELEDGFVLWTTIDRLKDDTERGGSRVRGTDGFPTHYPSQRSGGERGAVSESIRAVRVLGYDLPKEGALLAAGKIENQLEGDGKLFRVSPEGILSREDPAATANGEPTLVLIHGTASSTANAYSGFFNENRQIWSQIHERYEGRVYGFEHRTLTRSPLQNALEFLSAVPDGASLHLVSHSRGGLVGDLIAHGGITGPAFSADDLERELRRAYRKSDELYEQQLALYQEFNQRLSSAAPDVQRYVRVACPAAGTTLASGRLDVYLSIVINLLRRIPGVGPILGGLGELVAAVAKERTKPEVLPGLEAQMPKSAFVRLLNGSEHELQTDLTVLAGDSDGFFKNLANLFYWRANDLVVDTRSMYGGAPRTRRLWHLEENRHVTHVNYFRRFETAQVVQRGLLRDDAETTEFMSHRPKGVERGRVDEGKPTENTNLPGVILLPGIMGSNLAVTDGNRRNLVWLDKIDLIRGRGRQLAMDSGRSVLPDSVLDSPYDDFRDDLVRHGIHVMPMAYDWRRSLVDAVTLLERLVRQRLAESDQPLHLMAHSMGGLVASLFMLRCPDTWSRLRDSGGRLVQAGTPNRGSYVIPRILQGTEKMIRLIAMLDLDAGLDQWAKWTSRFTGILELTPTFGGPDFSKVQTWKDLDVRAAPRASDLNAAKAVWQQLSDQTKNLAGEGVLYVAGGPSDTPVYDPGAGEIRFTQRGDGRVTWDEGIPPGAPTWYVPVKHGSLLDTRSAFPGLRELLLDGRTDQLATERPAASSLLRGAPVDLPVLAPEEQIEFIPSTQDLHEAALGMEEAHRQKERAGPPVSRCEISVVHGDLRFSENPVIVGHYRGDQIVNAEAVLDRCLDGALRSRHQLDIYPGDVGSSEVLLKRADENKGRQPGPTGAIVVGLGNVGELTPGKLSRSVEAGLLRYAQACRERLADTSSLKLTALLVGSGEAGINMSQALDAFLIAVGNTNDALYKLQTGDGNGVDERDRSPGPLTYISHLTFIELYEDLALEALHELQNVGDQRSFDIKSELVRRDAGRRRPRVTTAPAWWPRVQIRSESADSPTQPGVAASDVQLLTYTTYGERARASVTTTLVQKPLVDRLVAETLSDRSRADARLPETLFELLVPPSLKAGVADRQNLQLVLDPGSAAYPWELLQDRGSRSSGPIGVASGLLRQLRLDDVDVVSHPEEPRILVVGDPPSSMPPLPGAQREAAIVADLFEQRGHWDVIKQIRTTSDSRNIGASSIAQSLLTNDLRILHLAGHGIYDAKNPMRSGMVIGDSVSGDNPYVLITSEEVRHMRMQPELVFVNCCHLGRIEETTPFHKLAASLAAQFIKAGVKAVVAAGWPVNDEAAVIFCSEFYKEMLNGADFGSAVRAARERTFHHESNTWGAYQCYGDPGFRLLMDLGVRSRVTRAAYRPADFLDPSELIVELGNLASRAKVEKSVDDKRKIASRLDELQSLAERKRWLAKNKVLVGFARLHGELRAFETAIGLYEQASRIADGGVTLTDIEQLANFRTRYGEQQKNIGLIRKALRDLNLLIDQHGKTAERLSLVGAAHKRIVQFQKARPKVRDSLRDMTLAYALAADLREQNWYYPATNALLGVVLLGGPWQRAPRKGTLAAATWQAIPWARREKFEEMVDQIDAALRRQEFRDFWDAVGAPDLAVVQALADEKVEERIEQLIAHYKRAIDLFGSPREVDSVVNNWNFAAQTARKLGNTSTANDLALLQQALRQ